jgi:hypothetical protein
VPADGNLNIKKGRKFMFGTGVMDGLSSLTIILMAVAGAGYALYISGESLAKKAAKADKSRQKPTSCQSVENDWRAFDDDRHRIVCAALVD